MTNQDILVPNININTLKKQRNELLEEESDMFLKQGLISLLDTMLDIADGEMDIATRNAHQEAINRICATPSHEPVTNDEKIATKHPIPEPQITRKNILEKASEIVTGKREDTYGGPEDSFSRIAIFWEAFLLNKYRVSGLELEPYDVALMMDLVKTARLIQAPDHYDSWIDKAGYAACGGEAALK